MLPELIYVADDKNSPRFFFKNCCKTDRKNDSSSHLLARFPGDYVSLSIHTAGSLAARPTSRMMAARTVAGSRGFERPILKRHSAAATDSVRPIERLPRQLEPAVAAGSLVDFGCGANDAFPCSWDRDSGDGVR